MIESKLVSGKEFRNNSDEPNDRKPVSKIRVKNLHELGMIEERPPNLSSALRTWYLPPEPNENQKKDELILIIRKLWRCYSN